MPRKRTIKKKSLLYEVFVRASRGLDHRYVGSVYAADAEQALMLARDCYMRRREGSSIWVVRAEDITALDIDAKDSFLNPLNESDYRHASNYKLPKEVDAM